ncbi:MAG: homocysteine S-methyltransferase family protein [Pseudomonadota bacterium]
MRFEDRLARDEPVLMDGALGTELERRGVPVDVKSWSAVAMTDHGGIVRDVHADYVRAGAELHIVNSFALGRQVLEPAGYGDRVAEFNRQSVELCRQAVQQVVRGRPQWIAGSLSTFAESSDRSALPKGPELRTNYREQAGLLSEAGVDALALEMLCDVDITLDAFAGALPTGLPLILGFTCQWSVDGTEVETQSGIGMAPVPLADVLEAVMAEVPGGAPVIYAIMHSDLDVTTAGLELLQAMWTGPVAAYPNSGTFHQLRLDFEDVCSPEAFADAAAGWIGSGVDIVGGCCGIGPAHIEALGRRLGRV